MKTSTKGLNLIKKFEGLSLTACKALSTEKYYTIGYGHYSKDVKKGDTITEKEATELLKKDIKTAENGVNKYNNIYSFNQNQFDALVSFCYNVGNIRQLTNDGKRTISEISTKMLEYNKSSSKVITGLTNRRKAEQKLFNTPIKEKTTTSYYPQYTGNSIQIDTIFRNIGVPNKYIGSWSARKPIATKNNISDYVGSMTDNNKLIKLAKQGKLIKI
jgi:GH24 family phage-related lysozyme (muramidase)